MYSKFGHLKINNFTLGTNGKIIILGVPILKHTTVTFNMLCLKFADSMVLKIIFLFSNI